MKKITDALIDLAHYIPTLQSEANTFAETGMIDDGERTLKLGRELSPNLGDGLKDQAAAV